MSFWITFPAHFSSGMVLQQQVENHLSGRTDPRLELTIELTRLPLDNHPVSPQDSNYGVVFSDTQFSDDQGNFAFELPPFKASLDPFELTIRDGNRSLTLTDILCGDVFLFLGDHVQHSRLVKSSPSADAPVDLAAPFAPVSAAAVPFLTKAFSTAAAAAVSPPIPYLRVLDVQAISNVVNPWQSAEQVDSTRSGCAMGLIFGRELVLDLKWPVGLILASRADQKVKEWLPRHKSGNFERLLGPLGQIGLRGVIWSGSALDLNDPAACRVDTVKLAESLRNLFRGPESSPVAFLMVQHLTAYAGQKHFFAQSLCNESLAYVAHHIDAPTALIQVSGLPLSNPLQTLAGRLKMICLGLLFMRKAPRSAPECESIELVGGKMILSFSNAGDGLRLAGDDTRARGFTVCGADRIYREASARVLYGVRVMVWHDEIPNPIGITYGFYDLNQHANLVSKDQLPVVPFRSDQTDATYCLPQEWMHCDEVEEWQVFDGQASLQREKANKSEGEASLKLSYQAGNAQRTISFGPLIDRPIDFPPLDLHHMDRLLFDLFNPDRQEKSVKLSLMAISAPGAREASTSSCKIVPALRWQTITFDLSQLSHELDLSQVIRLKVQLTDPAERGLIYIDNIRYGYR